MKRLYFIIGLFLLPFFASATSGACSSHGGVNCSAGPSYGGYAQCNDGFDSSVPFSLMSECRPTFVSHCVPVESVFYSSCTSDDMLSGWRDLCSKEEADRLTVDRSGFSSGLPPSYSKSCAQAESCAATLKSYKERQAIYDSCIQKESNMMDSVLKQAELRNKILDIQLNQARCSVEIGDHAVYDSSEQHCECTANFHLSGGKCLSNVLVMEATQTPIIITPTPPPPISLVSIIATSSPVHVLITKTLFQGSRDQQVRVLQEFLFDYEYLNDMPSGYFGLKTKAAVMKFQKTNGIAPTGIVGPLTRAKINQ